MISYKCVLLVFFHFILINLCLFRIHHAGFGFFIPYLTRKNKLISILNLKWKFESLLKKIKVWGRERIFRLRVVFILAGVMNLGYLLLLVYLAWNSTFWGTTLFMLKKKRGYPTVILLPIIFISNFYFFRFIK